MLKFPSLASFQPHYNILQWDNAANRDGVPFVTNDYGTVVATGVWLVEVIQVICCLFQCSFPVDKDTIIFFHASPLPVSVMNPMKRHPPEGKNKWNQYRLLVKEIKSSSLEKKHYLINLISMILHVFVSEDASIRPAKLIFISAKIKDIYQGHTCTPSIRINYTTQINFAFI